MVTETHLAAANSANSIRSSIAEYNSINTIKPTGRMFLQDLLRQTAPTLTVDLRLSSGTPFDKGDTTAVRRRHYDCNSPGWWCPLVVLSRIPVKKSCDQGSLLTWYYRHNFHVNPKKYNEKSDEPMIWHSRKWFIKNHMSTSTMTRNTVQLLNMIIDSSWNTPSRLEQNFNSFGSQPCQQLTIPFLLSYSLSH